MGMAAADQHKVTGQGMGHLHGQAFGCGAPVLVDPRGKDHARARGARRAMRRSRAAPGPGQPCDANW